MKNQIKRIFAVLITFSMMISLLPAQFVLAADDNTMSSTYVKYGTKDGLAESGHSGHVFTMEEVTGQAYDYKLTVGVYNPSAASVFLTSVAYDHDTVALVSDRGNMAPQYDIASEQGTERYMTIGNVTDSMTTDDYYLGKGLTQNTLFDSWSVQHTQEDESNIYQVRTVLSLTQQGITPSEWTKSETGSEYVQNGSKATYKFPSDELITLYTMYFKRQSGKNADDVTDKTIVLSYGDLEGYHGSATTIVGSDNLAKIQDENSYLIGFKEPESEPQTVNFTGIQNKDGTALHGATIKIYSSENKIEANLVATVNEKSNTYSTSLKTGKYYYTVSVSGYQDEEGSFEVGSATATVDTITMIAAAEATYETVITVTDADTSDALRGASVTIDGGVLTTDANGQVRPKLHIGTDHSATAVLEKYQTKTVKFEVKSGVNTAKIALVPERQTITFPTVKDSEGSNISGSTVILTKTSSNDTDEWGTSNIYNLEEVSEAQIPKNTDYVMTITAGGHSNKVIYVTVDADGNIEYFNDAAHTDKITQSELDNITLPKLEDPYYEVNVKKEDDGKTFTAKVSLNNIMGTTGTFGLRYDKEVFDFDSSTGFKLESTDEIDLYNPDPTAPETTVTVESGDADTIGYHVFSWRALTLDEFGEPLDATAGKDIATYTFTLKEGKSEKDIKTDAFTVMPYDKTSAGVNYYANSKDVSYAQEFLYSLWRYVDDENKDGQLGTGRLSESKATLNGFYQVFVNNQDGLEDADCMFDVMTNIHYTNFSADKAGLTFIVTDKENIPLDKAEVHLYDKDGNTVTVLTTDATGIATYPVTGDAEYKYVVSCLGYWDYPETDMEEVSVEAKTTKDVFVQLEKKIYHETSLQDIKDDSNTDVTADAVLTGDPYAYNDRDYHFNVKIPGMKADPDNRPQFVAIVEGTEYPVSYDAATNTYKLDAENVKGEPTDDKPDINGFPSSDIIIKMISGQFIEDPIRYTVTANAGAHGTVTYEQGTSSYQQDSGSTSSRITISEITPSDNSVGKFTFTAEDGYKVQKVIINGVQIDDYNNETSFDYEKFTDITMDSDITVIFWDGTTESDEAVVTLAVGPNGEALVSNPNDTEPVRNTRRTYIYPTISASDTFNFTLSADTGYSVVRAEQSINGGANTAVTGSPDYSVPVNKGDVTIVYVAFDNYTFFVNAYVKEGEGTIDPVGVIIVNMYDSLEFTMTAKAPDWSATAVDVNDTVTDNTGNNQPFVYKLNSIAQDTRVGAIFAETAYKVTGLVDFSQGKNLTNDPIQTRALVTCTRTLPDDGMTLTTWTTTSRTDATFDVELPKGTWKITLTKVGYINYTITDFEVEGSGPVQFGLTEDGSQKKITPYIGNTNGTGKTVSLSDAGVVGNGLRVNATANTKAKANVDDDSKTDKNDMLYIKANYGQRSVEEPYSDFLTK